ncbi:proteolipid ATPase SCDLUD_003403 [Saccharomycodes ludwigii]|nr:hypothetical protein SCDLUD_003403 [Saccharomycodes ludwigii]KAH3900423.1 hypothetical protein SCDLUD_003403 [Saccharomycodes ludwigii]
MQLLPGGVILVFVLVGLAGITIVLTIAYNKYKARKAALDRF